MIFNAIHMVTLGNEVALHLTATYRSMPVGADAWVKPDETTSLKTFQVVAAAAWAMTLIGRIEILETHEQNEAGLIEAIRIRRLK